MGWGRWGDWIYGAGEGDAQSRDVETGEIVVDAVSGGLSQYIIVGGAHCDLQLDIGCRLGVEAEFSGLVADF